MHVDALLGAVVMRFAQGLPVSHVIEQHRVTLMRDDVVDAHGYR